MRQQDRSASTSAADEAVDRVLGALRDVKPSPELEQNVRYAVQRRLASAQVARTQNGRPLHSLLSPLTAAALVCALLTFPSIRQENTPLKRQAGTVLARHVEAGSTARSQSREMKLFDQALATKIERRKMHSSSSSAPLRTLGTRLTGDPVTAPGQVRGTRWAALPSAELAALEAAAPTQPEPPLPITNDEQQIRRFAERHHAYQLAALDPRAESVHERTETEEFQRFFAPHPELSGNLPLSRTSSPADPK